MSSLVSAPSNDNRPERARERELAELRLLLNLSQILDENPDLSESGPLVLQTISDHVAMMRGAIYILRDESAEITIEAAFGLSEGALQRGVLLFLNVPASATQIPCKPKSAYPESPLGGFSCVRSLFRFLCCRVATRTALRH